MLKGIITGLGGRATYWVGSVASHPDVELVGYVEVNDAVRQKAIEQHDLLAGAVFGDLDAAIDSVDADFVLDVTPPAVHAQIAERAFAAGLHVLGEKPLSDDYATAVRVVEAGQQAGVRHMITQNYRFTPEPRTTRGLLADGLIGPPGQCDIQFYMAWADFPGSHYVTEPFMLINDMMVHHFDMMRYVLGADPVAVQAVTWNHPWGWHTGDAAHAIVFEFADGLWATHTSVGCAVGQTTSWNGDWRIEGPAGTITWHDGRVRHVHQHRTEVKVDREVDLINVPDAAAAMLSEFAGAVSEGRDPECGAADNLKSLAMVFGAIRSAQEHRRVELGELG